MAKHYEADDLLERGVLAEFQGKPDPKLFRAALGRFQACSQAMGELEKKFDQLIAVHKKGQIDPDFDRTLRKILNEQRGAPRIDLRGGRYANVSGNQGVEKASPADLLAVMETQKADLVLMKRQLDETIEAFRQVTPIANKGEFAATILSGRYGFSDKIQQSVSLIGAYGRYYTDRCMATIDATMQVYPAGLGWLRNSGRGTLKK